MLDKMFHAYDVRGVYPQPLNEVAAWKIGCGTGRYLAQQSGGAGDVLVGRDMQPIAEVQQRLLNEQLARERDIRVYVIGVGTTAGGFIPQLPPRRYGPREDPIHSVLDRRSLQAIAEAGGGKYYELGVEKDQTVALEILADVQHRAQATRREEKFTELYWFLLAIAGGMVCLGTLFIRERTELWWQLATGGGLAALLLLT